MTEKQLPSHDIYQEAEELSARLQRDIFPFAVSEIDPSKEIGIGMDVIEVERINNRRPGFYTTFFTAAEREYCETYGEYKGQPYGSRWCAKEALAKALGGIPHGNFTDIEVLRDEHDVPQVTLRRAARQRAEELGVEDIKISLAHGEKIAGAVCVVVRRTNISSSS